MLTQLKQHLKHFAEKTQIQMLDDGRTCMKHVLSYMRMIPGPATGNPDTIFFKALPGTDRTREFKL